MIKINIECDSTDEIKGLLSIIHTERDSLRDRIKKLLENEPSRFSLMNLVNHVLSDKVAGFSLTSEQKERIAGAFEKEAV